MALWVGERLITLKIITDEFVERRFQAESFYNCGANPDLRDTKPTMRLRSERRSGTLGGGA